MTTKGNAALKKSPAQDGLDDLLLETSASTIIDESTGPSNVTGIGTTETTTAADYSGAGDDEMEVSGSGGPRAELFFSHDAYDGMKETDRVIEVGQQFDGEYLGSFTSGQYNSRRHKLLVKAGEYAGKIIALPTCGKLDTEYQFMPKNARTIVRYDGRATKADVGPDWKGQLPYRYEVAKPKSVNRAIDAGQLKPNYQLKKKD